MKTPVTYYGGKQTMCKYILPLIPPHELYCEPFAGGLAVFFAKEKSKVEVINDLNRFVINFYQQCKLNFEALQVKIQSTPSSRALLQDAFVMYQNPHLFDDLEKAWALWILCNQGYSGKIGRSWGYGVIENRTEAKNNQKRINFDETIKNRLDIVQIECNDALKVIVSRDRPTSFFYIDPPYFNSNCGHYKGYSENDFIELLKVLSQLKGKFLLSSYPSEILTEYINEFGWHQKEFQKKVSVSKKRKSKTEVLTANYPI